MSEIDAISDYRLSRSFRRLWAIAFAMAIIFSVPVALLKNAAPWFVAIPIIAGIVLAAVMEGRDEFGEEIRDIDEDVATLSSDFKGLLDYAGRMVLEVPPKMPESNQELFAFLQPDKTPRKKITRVRLDTGEEIFVVSCDRYIDLLVSRLLEDSDKIVEHSLTIASKRFGSVQPEQLRQRGFLTRTILETLKSDFRGNWITVVSRNAESVLKELQKAEQSGVTVSPLPKKL
ncbi:MAG: hypothetical protein LV480_02670 [Methylacidiphilales bacterium]|nr:hypothetical protein [Candidatus Methylacidiphilales bacterium]